VIVKNAADIIRRLIRLETLIVVAFLATNYGAEAADTSVKTRLAFTSLSASFAPAWLANDRGYFKDYGLDVELIYTSTLAGIQATLAEDVQFVYTGGPNVMTARRRGADLTMIACTNPYNPYVIASRPNITSPGQLRGKRVGVNRLRDTSHLSALFALRELGVEPSMVSFTQIGSTPERLVALQTGLVEAAMVGAGSIGDVKRRGMNVLIDLNERRIPYANSCIAASEAFVDGNLQRARALVRGLAKGNAYLRVGNANDVMATIAKFMRSKPTDLTVKENYTMFAQRNPKHPVIPREGIVTILEMLGHSDETWRNWKPEQFYTTAVIDSLRRDGLLDKVYDELSR
jgi:NitT/TauT family transport system substrate-binding protein